jgi:hypothetical protein
VVKFLRVSGPNTAVIKSPGKHGLLETGKQEKKYPAFSPP